MREVVLPLMVCLTFYLRRGKTSHKKKRKRNAFSSSLSLSQGGGFLSIFLDTSSEGLFIFIFTFVDYYSSWDSYKSAPTILIITSTELLQILLQLQRKSMA
jgi:hypothetical protein